MEKLYERLMIAHEQYKVATTKTQFSNIWVECNLIDQALDAITLDKDEQQQRQLRKLMLNRAEQLEKKARRRYNLVEPGI
jgi:hypothetical protein